MVVESPLRPLTGEALVIIAEMMLGKISMLEGFGVNGRVHFLILGCFIPTHLAIAVATQVGSLFCRHELEKKQEYGDHVQSVESALAFTPLMFSTFGGLSREATIFYSHLNCQLTCCTT